MSIISHLESAEESLRQALINSLAEKEDTQLSELFEALSQVRSIVKKYPIRFTDNTKSWYNKMSEFNFNLDSSYLNSPNSPDVITFPSGNISITDDTISLG